MWKLGVCDSMSSASIYSHRQEETKWIWKFSRVFQRAEDSKVKSTGGILGRRQYLRGRRQRGAGGSEGQEAVRGRRQLGAGGSEGQEAVRGRRQ